MQMECREDQCQLSGRIAPVFLCKVLECVLMELVCSIRTSRFDMIHIFQNFRILRAARRINITHMVLNIFGLCYFQHLKASDVWGDVQGVETGCDAKNSETFGTDSIPQGPRWANTDSPG